MYFPEDLFLIESSYLYITFCILSFETKKKHKQYKRFSLFYIKKIYFTILSSR